MSDSLKRKRLTWQRPGAGACLGVLGSVGGVWGVGGCGEWVWGGGGTGWWVVAWCEGELWGEGECAEKSRNGVKGGLGE